MLSHETNAAYSYHNPYSTILNPPTVQGTLCLGYCRDASEIISNKNRMINRDMYFLL